MKKFLKLIIKVFAKNIIRLSSQINAGRYFIDKLTNAILHKKKIVKHKNLKFSFYVPNRLNFFRVDTFSSKEPETLEWIDTFKKKSVFWDIGANIGLYSCYAVKRADCQVYAFEPSVFNLELLAKNIYLNSLSNKIAIISFPLFDNLAVRPFYMTTKEWGGAQSNFGESVNYEGSLMSSIFKYKTVGMSIDQAVSLLNLAKPNYIKMDVDGIEHLILKGATNTLNNTESLLIEVNDNFIKQAGDTEEYLKKAGFKLKHKRHSEIITKSTKFNSFYNQIWTR